MLLDVVLTTVDLSVPRLTEAARAAEEAGFDGLWLYDHLSATSFGGTTVLELWTALTAVTLVTERMSVGPLVVNAAARHPAHVAVAAATVQEIAQGRLILGLGAGAGPGDPFAAELAMLGLPLLGAGERRALVADTVRYLRALWSGADHVGTHHRHEGATAVAVPDPVPPIIVGANGPRMAALAGEVADGLNLHDWEEDLAGLIRLARARAEARHVRSFEVSVEGPFAPAWLDRHGDTLGGLDELGVGRVMVRWAPGLGVDALRTASRLLRP